MSSRSKLAIQSVANMNLTPPFLHAQFCVSWLYLSFQESSVILSILAFCIMYHIYLLLMWVCLCERERERVCVCVCVCVCAHVIVCMCNVCRFHFLALAVPSQAPTILSIDLVTSTSFIVKWRIPRKNESNGFVRYFMLKVTENHSSTLLDEFRVYGVTKKVDNLHPYYTYDVRIAMVTTATGPYSPAYMVQTKEAGVLLCL